MSHREAMSSAALDAMIHVLDLTPADRVLVVTDPETADCGEAFFRAAHDHGCRAVLHTLPAEGRPLRSLPPDLPPLLDDADVVINAVVGDAREVPFRLQWIKAIEGAGRIRLGHSPGIDADMMIAGPLNVDYGRMEELAGGLLDGLRSAAALRLTTPAGTDLTMDMAGRAFVHDLKATTAVGANLPCGEVYAAPVETGADGRLVVDGCFGSHGQVSAPVTIQVIQGRAVDITCVDPAITAEIVTLLDTDDGARTIAEIGIGLNPGARLTPRMLEAEKAHSTAHVAFGDNDGIPGGLSRSTMHMDYLVISPTFEVRRAGEDWRTLMAAGKILP